MSDEIYYLLREKLDKYAVGFPATESGVEIKILKMLFSEADAELYLNTTLQLEEPSVIAERAGGAADEIAKHLEDMAHRGLLFRHRRGEHVRFSAAPYLVGFYEYNVNRMDREFAELTEAYFLEGMLPNISETVPPLRTIPVHEAVDATMKIASHLDARKIIQNAKKLAVLPCICRVQQGALDSACGKPVEVCFAFGSHADYYIENGIGRYIDAEEGLKLLAEAHEAGLVAQPASTINPGGMCNCCGDCCGVLRALQTMSNAADQVMNPYFAVIDAGECTSCETCLDRCQMDAIFMSDDDIATIKKERCIGCGLCVTTCPGEAISLEIKPEDVEIPANGMEQVIITAQKRGVSPF